MESLAVIVYSIATSSKVQTGGSYTNNNHAKKVSIIIVIIDQNYDRLTSTRVIKIGVALA